MSDSSDIQRVIELWADEGSLSIACEPWQIIEIVDDSLRPIAWVGPGISRIEGTA